MSSSKKLTCKATLRQVFPRVYRLEIKSVMLVFSTQLYDLLPLSSSLWLPLPPFPVSKYSIIRQCVAGRVWVFSCVEDHILQKFNTLYLTRFKTSKLLDHPKQKPRRVGGLRQINTCRKVPLLVNFFR
jgi:hypothetical protein